jgi:hypothetical protein
MQSLYDFAATDTSTWYGRRAKPEENLTPFSKQACPCDTCPLASKCAAQAVACKAFNTWSQNGTFFNSQIGRNLRSI